MGAGEDSIYVSRPTALDLPGFVPPGSNPPRRGKLYRLLPEEPLFRGMPTGLEAFLIATGRVWAMALHPESP